MFDITVTKCFFFQSLLISPMLKGTASDNLKHRYSSDKKKYSRMKDKKYLKTRELGRLQYLSQKIFIFDRKKFVPEYLMHFKQFANQQFCLL